MRPTRVQDSNQQGWALFDVVMAITVFAIAVTGIVVQLGQIGEGSAAFAKDRLIQYGIESMLTEVKHRPVNEMTMEVFDENLAVTYATTVEDANLSNVDGEALEDMYKVKVTATWDDDGGEQVETAEIFVYQPEERQGR
ncbi:MAG: hypothetical protein HKN23_12325 [Verrucomicrobiales bacterium]|nr:hypothetical protein [Verrucomicrobiales bacterium]